MLDLLTVGRKFTRPARRYRSTSAVGPCPNLAANPQAAAAAAAVDRWDRQTDRWTNIRPFGHTMRTALNALNAC